MANTVRPGTISAKTVAPGLVIFRGSGYSLCNQMVVDISASQRMMERISGVRLENGKTLQDVVNNRGKMLRKACSNHGIMLH